MLDRLLYVSHANRQRKFMHHGHMRILNIRQLEMIEIPTLCADEEIVNIVESTPPNADVVQATLTIDPQLESPSTNFEICTRRRQSAGTDTGTPRRPISTTGWNATKDRCG
jgi:hypothetical protein